MPRYRMKDRVGPHKHTDGVVYKPGMLFEGDESEIKSVIDKFDLIVEQEKPKPEKVKPPENDDPDPTPDADPDPDEGTDKEEPPKRTRGDAETVADPNESETVTDTVGLVLQHRGGGRYDVVNPETGNKINDDYLNKAEAEALVRK